MSDIAEKLRELSRWLLATDTDIKMPDDMIDPEIAADYTEVLEARLVEAAGLAAELDMKTRELWAEVERLNSVLREWQIQAIDAEIKAEKLAAENERLRAALKPSLDTKAAYIGEFSFPYTYPGEDGEEVPIKVTVPWTTIKEIMAAIRTHAALEDKSDESPEGKAAIEGEHEASKP